MAAPAVTKPRRLAGVGADQHYDGKLHYPMAVYGKRPSDGVIVSRLVADAAALELLLSTEPGYAWASSPADHGVETHPGDTSIAESAVVK